MNTSKITLEMWNLLEKEREKQFAYAFSDRDKKHIITQTYGKIISELWKLERPKFTRVRIAKILTEFPKLKDIPPDLAVLLYYSLKATDFVWSSIKVDVPQIDTQSMLEAIPGYQKSKKEFEELSKKLIN